MYGFHHVLQFGLGFVLIHTKNLFFPGRFLKQGPLKIQTPPENFIDEDGIVLEVPFFDDPLRFV